MCDTCLSTRLPVHASYKPSVFGSGATVQWMLEVACMDVGGYLNMIVATMDVAVSFLILNYVKNLHLLVNIRGES